MRNGDGFYSRHVSAVKLDWLWLPRFQDTLRRNDLFAEDPYGKVLKTLFQFYNKNSSWYNEIVELGEKIFLEREPDFEGPFEENA